MTDLTKKLLKKRLRGMTKEKVVQEVEELFEKFKEVQGYFQMKYGENSGPVKDFYKQKILQEYFPSKGFGRASNREARKLTSDFKKIAIYPEDAIDVILYRVEQGVRFTNEYGDIDEAFYNSIESSFEEACELISKWGLHEPFHERCQKVFTDTADIGWGFHDTLGDIYDEHFKTK